MRSPGLFPLFRTAPRRFAAAAVALLFLGACQTDESVAPDFLEARAVVCEPGATTTSELAVTRLPELRARGGYVARLIVDRNLPVTEGVVFRRITDALQQARTVRKSQTTPSCRITIQVSAGVYTGSTQPDASGEQYPLLIDVPDITLLGAYEMPLSAAGRATGPRDPARTATVLTASPALVTAGGTTAFTRYSEPLVVVDVDGARAGRDAVIQGFVMHSGHAAGDSTRAGIGVLSLRAPGLQVIGNSFEGNFTERVDVREGSALVERNYSSGPGATCDICINGPGGPFVVRSNRMLDGGIPGVLVLPAILLPIPPGFNQLVMPATSTMQVTIDNNEASGHQSVPVGTAFRIGAVGNGAPNTVGSMSVTLTRNVAHNNRFGLIVEAGFPVAGSALRGDVTISASNNTFTASCQADLLVSLSRHTTGLGLANLPYLRNSAYTLTLGPELPWSAAWFAHPANQGNSLIVNGAEIPNAQRHAYNANKSCNIS